MTALKNTAKNVVSSIVAVNKIAAKFADDTVLDFTARIAAQFDERAAYEALKASDNANIQKTLAKSRTKLASTTSARFLLAANVSETFINRVEHKNARFNVYALDKVSDLIAAISFSSDTQKRSMNAINNACVRSIFKLANAKFEFTHKLAIACASDKIIVDDAKLSKMLTRHNVSASTASTQASSTMQALLTLHVVSEAKANNEVIYTLNDNKIVDALREYVA